MKEAFENIVIENHKEANVQIFEYTNKVPEFMSISNLVVTKPGGLTTSESLASGLPIVVINPIPGQEEENAEYLVNHNTAIWLKKDDNVEEIINNLLSDSSKLEEMSNNAKSISKPNSTNDICKILLKNTSFLKCLFYNSLLPSNAFVSVISSVYSKSPPTGIPWAILVTFTPNGFINFDKYIAVASPSTLGFVANITSFT